MLGHMTPRVVQRSTEQPQTFVLPSFRQAATAGLLQIAGRHQVEKLPFAGLICSSASRSVIAPRM